MYIPPPFAGQRCPRDLLHPLNKQCGVFPLLLVTPPELDDKTVLLKTPHTLITGHTEMNLILNRKLPPWPAVIVSQGVIVGFCGGGSSSRVLQSCDISCKLQ